MSTGMTRAQNRAAMEAEIIRLGREHLTTHGAAGLSLRAIARDLGVVSSAVYRYVPSRDDLLTALLVQAYTDLADAVDAAMARPAHGDHRARLAAAALALRQWAVADPARWALLYGSPVPGYAAPAEHTVGPGTRVIAALLGEVDAAHAAGLLRVDSARPEATLRADLEAIRSEFAPDLPDSAVIAGVGLWSQIIGAVSLEVFGQYGSDTFEDPEALFVAQLEPTLAHLFVVGVDA